ncbi:hypothetical protein ILP92_13690 [Maribius pontilimi]|uniref:UrcA family protein n=1 Tax=Palleronia pontilimi TaxID=1964209 RepID=A0A934IJP8_9RHOB|nr:hypothetical protein [Palleronia pontilimi]MBJ3763805.1 hypothetical protein [Palleronia pontilimi]
MVSIRTLGPVILVAASLGAIAAPEDPAARCRAGLDRSLAAMEDLPLMKEELATGLMWARLDAETALASGDTVTCLEKLAVVNAILGLRPAAPGG